MLDLSKAAPLEGFSAAILVEASRVPDARRRLHAEIALDGAQRRVGLIGPAAPGAADDPILEKHAADGDHRQLSAGGLRAQLLGLGLAI